MGRGRTIWLALSLALVSAVMASGLWFDHSSRQGVERELRGIKTGEDERAAFEAARKIAAPLSLSFYDALGAQVNLATRRPEDVRVVRFHFETSDLDHQLLNPKNLTILLGE